MPKFLKKSALYLSLILCYLSSPSPVYAQTDTWENIGASLLGDTNRCYDANTGSFTYTVASLQGLECIFVNLFRIILPLAGIASFVILIIGGFQYLSSSGNPEQTKKAQSIITGAVIGLIATLGVWFIFRLLQTITGLDLLESFTLPG